MSTPEELEWEAEYERVTDAYEAELAASPCDCERCRP